MRFVPLAILCLLGGTTLAAGAEPQPPNAAPEAPAVAPPSAAATQPPATSAPEAPHPAAPATPSATAPAAEPRRNVQSGALEIRATIELAAQCHFQLSEAARKRAAEIEHALDRNAPPQSPGRVRNQPGNAAAPTPDVCSERHDDFDDLETYLTGPQSTELLQQLDAPRKP